MGAFGLMPAAAFYTLCSALLFANQLHLAHSALNSDILPLLFDIGSPANAGIKVKLTDTGLAYLREIFMRLISHEVSQLRINKPVTRLIPNAVGTVTVSGVRVVEYWMPESYDLILQPPNRFIWQMLGLGVRARGSFDADVLIGLTPVKMSGEWDALIDYLDYEVRITAGKDARGYPSVHAGHCSTAVHGLDVQILNAGTLIQTALQLVKGIIAGHVKPLLAREICEKTKDIVNKKVNLMMQTLPLKVPLNTDSVDDLLNRITYPSNQHRVRRATANEHREKRQTFSDADQFELQSADVKEFVKKLRTRDLVLDLTLLSSPTMSHQGYIHTEHNGQISWKSRGGTPFFPPALVDKQPTGRRMLQLFVSDYVLNSLLFAAHRHGLLNFEVRADPTESRHLSEQLQTTCTKFCIGDLLYPVQEEYPDHWVDIQAKTSKMPSVLFLNSTALAGVSGVLRLFVRNKRTGSSVEVIKAELSLTARVKLKIRQEKRPPADKIVGEIRIDRLELKLLNTTLDGVDQFLLDDVAEVAAELLDAVGNGALKRGFLVPKSTLIQLKKPRLEILDHTMLMETYFTVDEALLERLARQVLGDLEF